MGTRCHVPPCPVPNTWRMHAPRPHARPAGAPRRWTWLAVPLLLLTIGSTLSIAAASRTAEEAAEQRQQALRDDVHDRLRSLSLSMDRLADLTMAAAAHWSRTDEPVTDAGLASFLAQIDADLRHPELVSGLSYIAAVEGPDAAHLLAERRAIDPGFPRMLDVPRGPQAVVVAQSNPMGHKGNLLSADARRRTTLEESAELGMARLSAPIPMPGDGPLAVHIFAPVTDGPDGRVEGWIGTVFPVDALRESILAAGPSTPPLVVGDLTATLFRHRGDEASSADVIVSTDVVGRTWWLVATDLGPPAGTPPGGLLVLLTGLALSLTTATVTAIVTRDRGRLRRHVAATARERDDLASLVHAAFEDGPVGMAVIDPRSTPAGRFITVNDRFARFLGTDAESLTGRSCAEVVHDDDLALVLGVLTERYDGSIVAGTSEQRWVRGDGRIVWGRLSCSALEDTTRPGLVIAQVQDIDVHRRLEQEAVRERAFTEAVLRSVDVGVVACDADGQVTLWNDEALAQAGDVLGLPGPCATWPDGVTLRHPDGWRWDRRTLPLSRAMRGERVQDVEMALRTADGTSRTYLSSAQALIEEGRVIGAVMVTHDITERKATEEALTSLAMNDSLTGLPNRLRLGERLADALATTGPEDRTALLFLDLDRFKVLNDSRGHAVGDRVLQQVAERLRKVLRPGDLAARMGGDEFVVLCRGVTGEVEAIGIADRVRGAIERPMTVDGDALVVTCSVGVVVAESGENPEELLRRADLAMYSAKDQGRARVKVYEPSLGASVARRHRVEADLRTAIATGLLVNVYQPIVEPVSGRTVAVEALVRWRHGDRLMGPPAFIDVAEESGLIVDIDQAVLRQACTDAAASSEPVTVNVNMSSRMLGHPDLVHIVSRALAEGGLPASRLCIELTETALINASTEVDVSLQTLRTMGVRMALDDFGTGYSSLTYLRRFPVDVLKIDHAFVSGLTESPEDRAIVAATIDLAQRLGLQTTAEGIENEAQARLLTEMGCETLQGFWIGRPQPARDVIDMTGEVPVRARVLPQG